MALWESLPLLLFCLGVELLKAELYGLLQPEIVELSRLKMAVLWGLKNGKPWDTWKGLVIIGDIGPS